MSLDKAITHHKEYRKCYYGAKAVDPACRNHGSDDWAKDNRLYRSNKLLEKSEQDLDEIDFEPEWERTPVTLKVVKVSKFVPEFELEEDND